MWPYTIVFDLDISGSISGSIRIFEWTDKNLRNQIELIVSFRTQIEFHMIWWTPSMRYSFRCGFFQLFTCQMTCVY